MPDSPALGVLIVEDDPFVAMQLEEIVLDCGHRVIAIAECFEEVEKIVRPHPIDVALVDVNLKDGRTGPKIAAHLARKNAVTVVFVTGNLEQIPLDFCGAIGAVRKPFTSVTIAEVIDFAAGLRSRDGMAAIPKALVLPSTQE